MGSANRVKCLRREKRQSAEYQYQKDSRYFAQIAEGLKEAGAEELSELGAEDVRSEFSGIYFRADKSTLYRINYLSRLLSRCLAPLISYACPDTDTLYQKAKQIEWDDFFKYGNTFAVSGNVSDSSISHSKYAALRLKDAVADYFKEKTGRRPDVSVKNPDIQLNLHIRKDEAVISLDTSGGALHKRGYREDSVSAPMQETVAAAIIRFSEWDGSVPLYDPMCGSGTLLCEALMRYSNIPAGVFRKQFGFEFLPDFDEAVWKQVKKEADGHIRELPKGLIAGSDMSAQAVRASRTNLMGLHYGNNVSVEKADFRKLPTLGKHVIVTNPPYGIRMGGDEDLEIFYKNLGDFLKQKCKGSAAFVYFGDRKYIKNIGLEASWKKPIKAGGLDGRLVKYEMY
ncbi:MAG: class I SAM-dependent RNA methyltransferase [Proteobacteria bacterium]|nr:class I SAM-dependent RNA methyltransferase [Pseudomonadota bacterium]MBU4036555.1 class I SAM-dependent RNA methyltransferase [Pseudomonadota bacterium]